MAARNVELGLFRGGHFEREIIILCVRWYLSYRFFRKAIRRQGAPRVITLDGYEASHRAVSELKSAGAMPRRVRVRSSRYLNHIIEQDHRRIKQRLRPMLGFKRFDHAAVTTSGIELVQKIKKKSVQDEPSGRPLSHCAGNPGGVVGGLIVNDWATSSDQQIPRIGTRAILPSPS